ncbi:UNVERIFIED_CONTAM: Short-chain dehydrogenase, chloroplastic [Sesamum radiatum]|uniref:Short-chain dehydrogenase, chloroplastic n=1 Tax=Sesamum radiatum TaxID=300843 RepID=A0AAW2K0X9_SESRA
MEAVKVVAEGFNFICNLQFWRMSVLWTLSLVFSYFKVVLPWLPLPKIQCLLSSFTETLHFCQYGCDQTCLHNNWGSCIGMCSCVLPVNDLQATSGLGAAAAYALLEEVFMLFLVISDIKSQNQDACLKGFEVNLASFKSILEFNQSLRQWLRDSNLHSSVQLLINNAGILATSRRLTSEGYDQMLATNYIGAFCVTKVLLPLLENSPVPSRVVNVTSFTHWNVCLLLFSYELHRQINLTKKSHHLSVVATDPGAVKTNIMREIPSCVSQMAFIVLKFLGLLQSSKTGVCSILDAALAPPEVSGVYFFGGNGRSLNSSPLFYDANLAKELWATSCNLFEELQLAS